MNRNKRNVAIGAATGILIGFVFGAVFGTPGSSLETSGADSAKGNVIRAARFGAGVSISEPSEIQAGDTVKLTAIDENGKEVKIIMIK